MLKRNALIAMAAVVALGASTAAANADACSHHGHPVGTILGAAGGGLIGNAITHGSAVGTVGGAVAGGFAGNAIARSGDCHYDRYRRAYYYYDRDHRRHYVNYYEDRDERYRDRRDYYRDRDNPDDNGY
ncbi:MAG: glycine zipper 2TM domain-containing protein [Alphaproteobacteria bacterium]|nr:glycine zipper 2TM domain-containing protein [Alphaproteobacteria bacterium]